jgi:hypothetical protein
MDRPEKSSNWRASNLNCYQPNPWGASQKGKTHLVGVFLNVEEHTSEANKYGNHPYLETPNFGRF